MRRVPFLSVLMLLMTAFPAFATNISMSQVVLRGLDKLTGRLSTMTVNVGEKARFGALDVYVRVCYTHPPEEIPENASFLEVVEHKSDVERKVFSGWMFSSSPALSAMEHPVYDVWVLKCTGTPKAAPQPEPLVLKGQGDVAETAYFKLKQDVVEQKAEPVAVPESDASEEKSVDASTVPVDDEQTRIEETIVVHEDADETVVPAENDDETSVAEPVDETVVDETVISD